MFLIYKQFGLVFFVTSFIIDVLVLVAKKFSLNLNSLLYFAPFEITKISNFEYTLYFSTYMTLVLSFGILVHSGVSSFNFTKSVLKEMVYRIIPFFFAYCFLLGLIRLGSVKLIVKLLGP